MFKDTNTRSLIKGFSWRIIATTTTIIIIYIFFGKLDLAIAAGSLEWILKILLYWMHERIWIKIKFGRKRIEPFNLWFTGLPVSGKTTIADSVYKELEQFNIPMERLDSKDIRDIVPNIGFSREDRNRHMHRIGHLVKTLQKNSVSTVCSFVSPYNESRKTIRDMVKNNIIIYIKTDIETCKKRDNKGVYEKAIQGEYKNFTGVSDIYEEPQNADIIIYTDKLNIEEATKKIVSIIKKNFIK